jgi:putative ABC transport system permease protein
VPERSVLRGKDLVAEALAGVLQRPARSLLTTLGTVLGVGAFVAVLGLTGTATGQISGRFDALTQTTVTVTDIAGAQTDQRPHPPTSFPAEADSRITGLNGVVAAGVYWKVPLMNTAG